MNKYIKSAGLIFIIILLSIIPVLAQEDISQNENRDDLISLTVRDANIKDVLVMLSTQSGINLIPDETVTGQVTIDLKNVEIKAAMNALSQAYGYNFKQFTDNVYMVSKTDFQLPPQLKIEKGKLSLKTEAEDVRKLLLQIADKTDIKLELGDKVTGKITIDLNKIPLAKGIQRIVDKMDFSLNKAGNVYKIIKLNSNVSIFIKDGKIDIKAEQAEISQIIRGISRLSNINLVLFSEVRGRLNLNLNDITIKKALKAILRGTRFTYEIEDNTYYIGSRDLNTPSSKLFTNSKIISLDFMKVEQALQLMPRNISNVEFKVMKGRNALMVTGTESEIKQVENFISKIDKKTPQIVVEALILEISRTSNTNPALEMGLDKDDDGDTILFDSALGQLTYKSVLNLPSDFYFKVQALVEQGKATIKARPNITTLSGQQASIDVGTVQYYRIEDNGDEDNNNTRYQSIDAGVNLTVTPWVGDSGFITLDLKPSVSNIAGASSGDQPPNIGRRKVDTTVRVKDGQTIVIGGLIQDIERQNEAKVPVLSEIPYVGNLFKDRSNDLNKTELVMYITPHILNEEEIKANSEKTNLNKNKISQFMFELPEGVDKFSEVFELKNKSGSDNLNENFLDDSSDSNYINLFRINF